MFESTTADVAFARYEEIRARLPDADHARGDAVHISNLGDVADQFDIFVFDAYGVLNAGREAIPGAVARIGALRARSKSVRVLTNAAHLPHQMKTERYQAFGFDFSVDEIWSSRDALIAGLEGAEPGLTWAVAAKRDDDLADLPGRHVPLSDETMETADAFILLSRFDWTHRDTDALTQALEANPRPVWCGNPDLVAPVEGNFFLQPGWDAHALADRLGILPALFGKPYANAFDLVTASLPSDLDPDRVLMIGDTLHTDVLGGAAAGFRTALVTGHGVLKNMDVDACIEQSGIVPDFVLPRI